MYMSPQCIFFIKNFLEMYNPYQFNNVQDLYIRRAKEDISAPKSFKSPQYNYAM